MIPRRCFIMIPNHLKTIGKALIFKKYICEQENDVLKVPPSTSKSNTIKHGCAFSTTE